MMTYVTVLIGLLLLTVTFAFVFSEKFRNDVIAGEGETEIFGILNAKGAIIVLILALFLGAILFASSRSSIVLEQLSAVVPEEAPDLARQMNDDLQQLQRSHLAIIEHNFDMRRELVERFFEDEWLPTFSEYFSKDQEIRAELARVLASGSDAEIASAFSELNLVQQETLMRKRDELFAPIVDQERALKQEVASTYARVLEANDALRDLLASLRSEAYNADSD